MYQVLHNPLSSPLSTQLPRIIRRVLLKTFLRTPLGGPRGQKICPCRQIRGFRKGPARRRSRSQRDTASRTGRPPSASRSGPRLKGSIGFIETKFCKKIIVGKLSPRSSQCTPLHCPPVSSFSFLKIAKLLTFANF